MYSKSIRAFFCWLLFAFSAYAGPKPDTAAVNRLNTEASQLMMATSDSSLLLANRALALADQLNYPQGKAAAYATIAKMHYKLGNYLQSFNAASASLRICNENNDAAGQANAYNVLGLVFLAQDDLTRSLNEFKMAAGINLSLGNTNRLCANYFNIGVTYIEANRLDSAEVFFRKSIAISKKTADTNMFTMALNRLADIDFKNGKPREALALYLKVVDGSYRSTWEDAFAYTGLAECYYSLKDYKLALFNAQKGLALAKKMGTKWDIRRAAQALQLCFLALNDYRNAYRYLDTASSYGDSLLNEKKTKDLNLLQLQQQEARNQALLKKNQLAAQQISFNQLLIAGAAVVLVFLLVIVLISLRNRVRVSRLIAELKASNATKDQLFAIIGHDLRSPVNSILSSLRYFNEGALDEGEIRYFFTSFARQMTATSIMLDNLLHWAGSQQKGASIKVAPVVLPDLCGVELEVFISLSAEKDITISHVVLPDAVISADSDQIRIVLRNLINNALKFTPRGGKIDISYGLTAGKVSVAIRDTGLGMPEETLKRLFAEGGGKVSTYGTENEKGIGIGLMLVKKYVEMNNGRLYVESIVQQGTTFRLEFLGV